MHYWVTLALVGLTTVAPAVAEACGCFAAPTVAQPVVQAGERIVFVQSEGRVTAQIQIQYQGDASDFAWMLPVPAVPEFRLGSESLFEVLEDNTRPRFVLTQVAGNNCPSGGGCDDTNFLIAPATPPETSDPDLVVVQSSAGPYDYAVVRADDKAPMFDWLRDNGYFVPSASDAAFDPYVRPGAFFLALKLRAGATTGDLQPVVVDYPADMPTIPIVLTSMGAVSDMPIQVWVFGDARAVPRNYQHVTPNFAFLDWANGATNYADVVGRAIDEAQDHHAFITEFAGGSLDVRAALGDVGQYGDRERLDSLSPQAFVDGLRGRNFRPSALRSILTAAFEIPGGAFEAPTEPTADRQMTSDERLWDVYWDYASRTDGATFTSSTVAAEIWEKVAEPHYDAIELISTHRYVTRLLTILSPDEMTKDPAFVFNPDLMDVLRQHDAVQRNYCDSGGADLELEDGRVYSFDEGVDLLYQPRSSVPFAALITNMRQEGAPEIVVDNRALLEGSDDLNEGCTHITTNRLAGFETVLLVAIALLVRRRRR